MGIVLFCIGVFAAIVLGTNSKYAHAYILIALLVTLGPWVLYGERLNMRREEEKRQKKIEQLAKQSDWHGVTLFVRYRWIKALFATSVCAGVLYLCCLWAIVLASLSDWTPKGILGFVFLAMLMLLLVCLTCVFFAGMVGALLRGYAVKVDLQGLHLSGLPALPFSAMTRAGYREQIQGHDSSSTFHLLIELDWAQALKVWPRAGQALLAGYLMLWASYFRKSSVQRVIQIYAGHWDTPAPTIAAAIRNISEKLNANPVVEYSALSTLAESRQEYQLMKRIMGQNELRVDDEKMQDMYARFASGQRLTDTDTNVLEASFASLDKKLKSKTEAAEELVRLQGVKHKRFIDKISIDTRHFSKIHTFFILVLIIWVIAFLAKIFV
jgi:hypothetical protein